MACSTVSTRPSGYRCIEGTAPFRNVITMSVYAALRPEYVESYTKLLRSPYLTKGACLHSRQAPCFLQSLFSTFAFPPSFHHCCRKFKTCGFGNSIGVTWRITMEEGGTKLAMAIWNSPPFHGFFSFSFRHPNNIATF